MARLVTRIPNVSLSDVGVAGVRLTDSNLNSALIELGPRNTSSGTARFRFAAGAFWEALGCIEGAVEGTGRRSGTGWNAGAPESVVTPSGALSGRSGCAVKWVTVVRAMMRAPMIPMRVPSQPYCFSTFIGGGG